MAKLKNETGNRYGRLLVIKRDTTVKKGAKPKWICQCDCGKIVSVLGTSLRRSNTRNIKIFINSTK